MALFILAPLAAVEFGSLAERKNTSYALSRTTGLSTSTFSTCLGTLEAAARRDANCLFRGLARSLFGDLNRHQELREEAAEWLFQDLQHPQQNVGNDIIHDLRSRGYLAATSSCESPTPTLKHRALLVWLLVVWRATLWLSTDWLNWLRWTLSLLSNIRRRLFNLTCTSATQSTTTWRATFGVR